MLFSSVTFLYWFFPALIAVYFLVRPVRGKNLVLLAASLLFYFWGEPKYTLLLIASVLSGYVHGLLIERFRGRPGARAALISGTVISIGLLAVFKYADFFIGTVNSVTGAKLPLPALALPIGISFYTFQILSYLIDLYRGGIAVQRDPLTLATYVALFPQLIAGPIVRYAEVERELSHREHTAEGFASGAFRFTVGLAKKVLITNALGELCEIFKAAPAADALWYWLYIAAFALHLYFDFSGYSDMAIGLGRIFGFSFPENFNYPFVSKSVSEFWRRWHMTLGSWFRDYVYIPLGGNRVKLPRWMLNVLIVWLLTGLWHGAGWTFIVWGLMFALLLAAEKLFLAKYLKKLPAAFAHIYTMLMVLLSFIVFDAPSMGTAFTRIAGLFGGAGVNALWSAQSLYYLKSYAVIMILGIVGATPLVKNLAVKFAGRNDACAKAAGILRIVVMLALLSLVTAYLVDGSFNPFIYFRF